MPTRAKGTATGEADTAAVAASRTGSCISTDGRARFETIDARARVVFDTG
jgi:hypothetical protein